MEPVRLNKYLSELGICSRREADRLTEEGQILVNGTRAVMGQKVTDEDEISVSGSVIGKTRPQKVIIAVNKPVGVVCTTRAFNGEENIVNLVDYGSRLYPVGRLDKESEGLIFLTNNGQFAEEVTNAANYHEKEYEVVVSRAYTDQFLERLEKGVFLKDLDKKTAPCKITAVSARKFRIVLTQGMNRQIRRMCETLGYEVISLKRIRIMNVELGDLETGKYREITGDELKELMDQVAHRKKPAPRRTAPRPEKRKVCRS